MSSIPTPSRIRPHHALIVLLALILGVTWYCSPGLVRGVVVARLHAITDRPVSLEAVELGLLTGRLTLRGFRLGERGGSEQGNPFADFESLEVRVNVPSLLLGRVRIREAVLSGSTVRVVREPNGDFNFSDLLGRAAPAARPLDLTIDRFSLKDGRVTLEDRALPERRTWVSERITIEARDVSTHGDAGRALATSVTAGAAVSIDVKKLRLYPIHMQATVTTEGLDLALARVYQPHDAPLVVERGRASTVVTVVLDAREGLRADATGRFDDVALVQPGAREPLALLPRLTTELRDFTFRQGALRVGRFAAEGTMSVRDPTAKPGSPFRPSGVRASVEDLTWPATTPGRVDLLTSVPGGGTLAVAGTVRPPPANTELRARLTDLDLAPWTRRLPVAARVTGLAQADLRIDEPLAAGVPARIQGTVAVNRLGVGDGGPERLGARRVEASGLELHWPERLVVERVLISGLRGVVERDRDGEFPLTDLLSARSAETATRSRESDEPPAQALAVEVGEIRVQDAAVTWRDEGVSPPARLDVSGLHATVTGAGWPVRGPLGIRVATSAPGGGHLSVSGRVLLDPPAADLRVVARNAELAPYQPYLATPARVTGAADLDVSVVVPALADGRAQVRGTAGLSRLDVRDGERTVMRLERASATGVDAEWPDRVGIARLAVAQPWVLIERDDKGILPLRGLLTPRRAREGPTPAAEPESGDAVAVTVGQLIVEQGGIRVVDRAVSPPFAVDLQSAALRVQGFSTVEAKPARISLTGRLGSSGNLALEGTVRAFGDRPFLLDVNGELTGFAVPRTNPYILQQVGWTTNEGSLASKLRWRVDGDALTAKTDLRVSHLHLVRSTARDEAQARIGLPLGLLTALMKDARGDITLSIPVGGRLSDPRFDFREAIWGAVRTVAVNAIVLPVSWIGRVQVGRDARIERIQVDPIPFPSGTDTLTPDAQERVARLAAFLERLPEVRMAITPVVSSGDLAERRRLRLSAALDRAARDERLARDAAAARLFEQRFPGRPVPSTREATLAALVEREPEATSDAADLGKARVAAVRTALKRAGIESARLSERGTVQREDAEGHAALDVLEPETPRPSRVRGILQKLGMTVQSSAPSG